MSIKRQDSTKQIQSDCHKNNIKDVKIYIININKAKDIYRKDKTEHYIIAERLITV
jgi:hypothetical protein